MNIRREEIGPVSTSSVNSHDSSNDSHMLDIPSNVVQAPVVSSSSSAFPTSNTRGMNFLREENQDQRHHRNPFNSGLCISITFFIIMGQIVAAIIVLSLSRKEKPRTPLFAWIIGYTIGCIAMLPHLYWRYMYRDNNLSAGESTSVHLNSSNNTIQMSNGDENIIATSSNGQNAGSTNRRLNALVDQFKMALDFFLAIWFVVGNVWVFGQHSSSYEAPNLYRLSIVFLIFSCIGYAMPLILCVAICCCFPCIASLLVSQEDVTHHGGARFELIDALPTYKIKSTRTRGKGCETINEGPNDGGIVAAGTNRERILSPEDAMCCICLASYAEKDELRELPCSHLFHKKCVDEWLRINVLCPLCKSSIMETSASTSHGNSGFHSL